MSFWSPESTDAYRRDPTAAQLCHRIPRVDYEIAGIAKAANRQLQAYRARATTLHGAQLRFCVSEELKFLARI